MPAFSVNICETGMIAQVASVCISSSGHSSFLHAAFLAALFPVHSLHVTAFFSALANHLEVSCSLTKHPLGLRSQACSKFLVDFGRFDELRLLWVFVAQSFLGHAGVGVSARGLLCRRCSFLDLTLGHAVFEALRFDVSKKFPRKT